MDITKEQEHWIIKIPTQQNIDDTLFLEVKFHLLAQQWYEEVKFFSFAKQRENETYALILAMGNSVVPLMIQELEKGKHLWFSALRKLSHVNPVQEAHKGNPQLMAKDWLHWAKEQQII